MKAPSPVTWLMGIPWSECQTAGSLMGTKTILNEFLAYLDLAHLPPDSAISPCRVCSLDAVAVRYKAFPETSRESVREKSGDFV